MAYDEILNIELTPAGKDALARLQGLWEPDNLLQQIFGFFEKKAPFIANSVIKNTLAGQMLKRRTGDLARSVIGRAEIVNGLPGIRIGIFKGPALAYARLQELGGIVKPVGAKALSIPVNDALTPAGVPRYNSPREWPGKLRFVPFRRGIAIGALYDEQDLKNIRRNKLTLRSAKAAYLLMSQVKIPSRPFLRSGLLAELPQLSIELGEYLASLPVSAR